MRSGRMRRLLLTRYRWVISPLPSMLGGRVSSRTTWSCLSWSSAGVLDGDDALVGRNKPRKDIEKGGLAAAGSTRDQHIQVALTMPFRTSPISGVRVLKSRRSSISRGSRAKRLMDTIGPSSAKGGMMAFTREPSATAHPPWGRIHRCAVLRWKRSCR